VSYKRFAEPLSNHRCSVAFHHDLIISKDDKGRAITLWKIVGFSSSDTPAQPLKAVTVLDSTKDTRSAFLPHSSPDDISPQYIRLVEFVIEDCREFYMRFSLYTPPLTSTRHPILAICDSKSKVFFWDLARLDSYHEYINSLPTSQRPQWLKPKARPKKNNALNGVHDASPYSSLASSSPHAKPNETFPKNFTPADIKRSKADWDKKYSTGRSARLVESAPEENMTVEQVTKNMLDSHRSPEVIGHVLVGGEHILVGGRQATWSPGGEFCVVGGSPNVVAVFQRWGDINWK
jgi:polycomb protein EED